MKRSVCSALVMLSFIWVLSGCGGGYSKSMTPIGVSLSPSTAQSMDQGQTVNITATVANDSAYKGVTWSVSGGGTLNGPTTTTVTYNAPSSVTSNTVATVTATSVADMSKTASLQITVAPAPTISTTSLAAGTQGTAYSATVSAAGGTGPYSWSVSSGSLPAGLSLGSGTTSSVTVSGTPTGQGTSNFTMKVTDAAGLSATQMLSITVGPPPPLAIATTTLASGTVGTAYSQTLQATGGFQPYTWAVTVGSLPAGLTLNTSTGVISGTPTATGTSNFTVKATDSETPAATATANLSIAVNAASACGSGSESLLNGQYAFLLKGFRSPVGDPALVGGVITVDGTGHITAGAMDMNLKAGVQSNLPVGSGSYSIGSDQRGCMSITTPAGTQNYRFSVGNISSGVASTGHMIDFDTTGPFTTGLLRKQNPAAFSNAQISGSYAFGGSSIQNAAVCNAGICGGEFAVTGVVTFDGSGGVTGGTEDVNQNGILDGNSALTTWPVTSPININSVASSYNISSNGRGTLTLALVGFSGAAHSVLYVVSATEAFFMSSDPQTTSSIFAGQAFQQSGGPHSGTSLSGNYVGYNSALGSTAGTSRATIFLVNVANPNITGTSIQNDGGTISSGAITATYTVASNGRVLVTGGNHPPLLYLVNPNEVFFLDSGGRPQFGFVESQTSTSASGTFAYGRIDPQTTGLSDQSGVATLTSGSETGTTDINSRGSLSPNQTFSFTYSIDSAGLGHIPSGCTIGTTCQSVFVVISPTKAVSTDVTPPTANNPSITVADQ